VFALFAFAVAMRNPYWCISSYFVGCAPRPTQPCPPPSPHSDIVETLLTAEPGGNDPCYLLQVRARRDGRPGSKIPASDQHPRQGTLPDRDIARWQQCFVHKRSTEVSCPACYEKLTDNTVRGTGGIRGGETLIHGGITWRTFAQHSDPSFASGSASSARANMASHSPRSSTEELRPRTQL